MSESFQNKDYTKINFNTVNDIVTEWNGTCQSFEGERKKASEDPTFIALEEAGISGGFPAKYDAAMEKISSGIQAEMQAVKQAVDAIIGADKKLRDSFPHPPGGGGGKKDEPEEETTPAIDNSKDQEIYYKNISIVDMQKLVDYLNKASQELKMPIDELLANEENGSKLIEIILKQPNLSETLKTLLTEGTSEVSIVALKSFIKGDFKEAIGFDDKNTVLTMKTYLANISNGTVEAGKTPTADDLAKVLVKDMSGVAGNLKNVNKDNIQDKISEIYRGSYGEADKISDATQAIIGTNIDVLSNANGLYYEDLLGNKEVLLKSVDKLTRASIYSNLLQNCKNSTNILASLLK